MEDVFGRFDTSPKPVKGVYGGAYQNDPRWTRLTDAVASTERRLGRRPRMLVAKMGQDGHDRGANLVSSMFGDLGFEIVPGPLFQTPSEAAALAVASDVDVVGASSLAAGHKTLIPELIGHLADQGRADIKIVAGGVIPAQDYDALRKAGVSAIFGPAPISWRRRPRCCAFSATTCPRRTNRQPTATPQSEDRPCFVKSSSPIAARSPAASCAPPSAWVSRPSPSIPTRTPARPMFSWPTRPCASAPRRRLRATCAPT